MKCADLNREIMFLTLNLMGIGGGGGDQVPKLESLLAFCSTDMNFLHEWYVHIVRVHICMYVCRQSCMCIYVCIWGHEYTYYTHVCIYICMCMNIWYISVYI